MITVEIPAPYLSLEHLVSAIAKAVARTVGGIDGLVNIEESEAAAAVTWESKIRSLAESRAIKGHHWDTLAPEDWVYLNLERDAFFLGDLNACSAFTRQGLTFVVVEDQRERLDCDVGVIEIVNNGAGINWRYWVDQMPTLSAGDAARLMAGLDPDLYADLDSRPVLRNNVQEVCKNAMAFERLAIAEGKLRATPTEWLEWALERQFKLHSGFILAVDDKHAQEAAEAAFNALPQKEADHWKNGHPADDGYRLVTYKFAGLQSAQHFTLAAFVEEVTTRTARWQAGTYAVAEAAQILADAGTDIDAEVLCQQMESAVHAGALTLRRNDVPLSKDGIPRGRLWNRFVQESDVNDWLASTGARYRLHFPYAPRVVYYHLQFPRLLAVNEWRGGMLADTDVVTLGEAAEFASKHAGVDVSIGAILRAAARGQIPLRAVVQRRAKVRKFDGGVYCNKGQENENVIPKGCIPTLPLTASQQLANTRRASWRTFDGFEEVDGELMRYTKGSLTSDEPDFETNIEDCRVVGADVHALADAFCEAPTQTHERVPVRVMAASASNTLVVPFKKAALIAAHVHEWPSIARDISDANTNGLAAAAKASERGWLEDAALIWARANGKLISVEKPADSLAQAMHNLGNLPTRKHTIRG